MSLQYFDLPPAYQTVDPRGELPWAHADEDNTEELQIEREDTPQNRFEHHVELRQELQSDEWQHMSIDRALFGSVQSQRSTAHDWVVAQWKKYGLWNSRWPETGPESNARWGAGGPPASLLGMEITSHIEHLVFLQAPKEIPCLSNIEVGGGLESSGWPVDRLVSKVLAHKRRHWKEAGFASASIKVPSVKFHQDFASLRSNLPEPARNRLDSYRVKGWNGLSARPRHRVRQENWLFRRPRPEPHHSANDGANGAGSSESSITEETAQRLVRELGDRSSESPGSGETTQVLLRQLRSRNRSRWNGERGGSRRLPAIRQQVAASCSAAVRPQAAASRSTAVRPQPAASRSAAVRPREAASRSAAVRPQPASSQSAAVRPQGIRKRSSRRKP